MRLVLFILVLITYCSSASISIQNCLVGNLLVKQGVIVSKSIESKSCSGLCRKQTMPSKQGEIVLLSCEQNSIDENHQECSSSELETSCFCRGDKCNRIEKEEKLSESSSAEPNNVLCYVGFHANITKANNVGDIVACSVGNVCTIVTGEYEGIATSVYACMPKPFCDDIFDDPKMQYGTRCSYLRKTNIETCCCYGPDCSFLAPVDQPNQSPWDENYITCYQGVSVDGILLTGGAFTQCYGQCGSGRFRSIYNYKYVWVEVFMCSPSDVFTSLKVVDQCKKIDITTVDWIPTSLMTTCACGTDKCLNPTVVPPVYPV